MGETLLALSFQLMMILTRCLLRERIFFLTHLMSTTSPVSRVSTFQNTKKYLCSGLGTYGITKDLAEIGNLRNKNNYLEAIVIFKEKHKLQFF